MKKTLLIAMAAILSGTFVTVCAAPTEAKVDETRARCSERAGKGEDLMLAACAFGYAAAGCAKKATACASEIKTRYADSPVVALMEPGFLKMPCPVCLSIQQQCKRCEGKGKVEGMKGGAPVNCLVCKSEGIIVPPCDTCKSSRNEPMSKTACILLYWSILRDLDGPLRDVFDSRNLVTQYTEQARLYIKTATIRRLQAQRIEGRVVQTFKGGDAVVKTRRISQADGIGHRERLIYIDRLPQSGRSGSTIFLRRSRRRVQSNTMESGYQNSSATNGKAYSKTRPHPPSDRNRIWYWACLVRYTSVYVPRPSANGRMIMECRNGPLRTKSRTTKHSSP